MYSACMEFFSLVAYSIILENGYHKIDSILLIKHMHGYKINEYIILILKARRNYPFHFIEKACQRV